MVYRAVDVDDYTKIQRQIIKEPLTRSFAVVGGPGTGKTIIALERLQQVISSGTPGYYIAYNRNLVQLANYIMNEKMHTKNEIYARTMNSWFAKIYYDITGEYMPYGFNEIDWDDYNEKIDNALETGRLSKTPILIADEIQDFPAEVLKLINKLGETINIFVDDNQKIDIENVYDIFDVQGRALSIFSLEENFYDLTENFRNTREIERVAKIFMHEGDVIYNDITCARISAWRGGDKPALIHAESFTETCHRIGLYSEQNPARAIGVILMTTNSKVFRQYQEEFAKRKCDFQYTFGYDPGSQFDYGKSGIYMMTYKTCKGLEFDDVFILEADTHEKSFIDAGTRRQYYVACTRARENLSFIYRDPESSVIRQLLAPENIRLFRKISWEPQEILVKYMKVFRE